MGEWVEVKFDPKREKHSCKTCKCKSIDIGVTTDKWDEIIINKLKDTPIDDFSLDRWYNYWMDEVDPRGSKRLSLELFEMCGGGDY